MKKAFSALLIGATLAMPINIGLCSAEEQSSQAQSEEQNSQVQSETLAPDVKARWIATLKQGLTVAAIEAIAALSFLCLYKFSENRILKEVIDDLEKKLEECGAYKYDMYNQILNVKFYLGNLAKKIEKLIEDNSFIEGALCSGVSEEEEIEEQTGVPQLNEVAA